MKDRRAVRSRVLTGWLVLLAGGALTVCQADTPSTNPVVPDAGTAGAGGRGGSAGGAGGTGGPSSAAGGAAGSTSSLPDAATADAARPGDTSASPDAPVTTAKDGAAGDDRQIELHFIDVEGGAATALVTPGRKVILFDAGWPEARDADRIHDVVKNRIGASKIDYLVVTHYHTDHVGGVPALAKKIEISNFVDHGMNVEGGMSASLASMYESLASAKRMTVKAGDMLTVDGVELTCVSAHGRVITSPPAGITAAANPACAGANAGRKNATDENAMSAGFLVRFGQFTFLTLGDLLAAYEHELACPMNQLGKVKLFQVTHHGLDSSNAPQLIKAIAPTAAVVNNGATKGGAPSVFESLVAAPHRSDVWQLHRATRTDAAHNAPADQIANLESDSQHASARHIRATARATGRFTLLNTRTNFEKAYE